jgi:SpoIID/LytB domain protein
MYLGIPHEAPSTTAAVNATTNQVVLYKGKVATTYFFSTSGGRTASVQDINPNAAPVPYLVSVADPYDSISPYHDWGPFPYTARKLGRGLKSPGKLVDVQTVASSSGRVERVVATGARGQATATGAQVRAALGLRSTWFQIGVLALGAPTTPVAYGTRAALSGTARGVTSVQLQQQDASGVWKTVSQLTPRGGAVAPKVKPTQSSSFRLFADKIASAAVRVSVAPTVRLHVPAVLTGFWGTVRPGVAGTTVTIQRQTGSGWRFMARVKTTANGRFTLSRAVGPGTYRALVSAKGMAPGMSKPVTV